MRTDTAAGRRFSRDVSMALALALLWSAALVIAAALAPAYQSTTVTTSGTVTHGSATLVNENGLGVLLITGIPLFLTVLASYALWRRRGRPGAGTIAWIITGSLAGFNLLAMLSIGVFILPVTACLAIACSIHQRSPHRETRGAAPPI
jgi:hypothetical protein